MQYVGRETLAASDPLLAKAHAIAVVSSKVLRETIARLDECRVIARYGTGTDNVDVAAATERGIVVTNVPDFCTPEMADHTMALLLGAARKILLMDRAMRSGHWQARVTEKVHRIAGQRLGLVGFGRIARAVATRAAAFGLSVCWYDPYLPAGGEVARLPLDELLKTSDFVSLHIPLTPETRHLIGEAQLRLMKPNAILINTARGGVLNPAALVRALSEHWIAGAALDVFEDLNVFGPAPAGLSHPLFGFDNVLLTPHSGGCSEESLAELMQIGAEQVLTVLRGEWPPHCVNPEVQPRQPLTRAAGTE